EKKITPAWKVALLAFVASFAVIVVVLAIINGISSGDPKASPYERGRSLGRQVAPFIIFAPLVGYIVQKSRIDRAKRP
ncbi:MAG: hypothetical protein JWO36_825, partial [Myxococcales bacterium]|nr:hypothetical protein [Myxococcales bacterium]